MLVEKRERLRTIMRRDDGDGVETQEERHDLQNIRVVVHEQHGVVARVHAAFASGSCTTNVEPPLLRGSTRTDPP